MGSAGLLRLPCKRSGSWLERQRLNCNYLGSIAHRRAEVHPPHAHGLPPDHSKLYVMQKPRILVTCLVLGTQHPTGKGRSAGAGPCEPLSSQVLWVRSIDKA